MRYATLFIASLLLLDASASAEDEAAWAAEPALRIGNRTLTRADVGRRLLHSFGMRLLRGHIYHEQIRQAIAAKNLSVDPAAVQARRKTVIEDLEKQKVDVPTFLRRSRITMDTFDKDVWSLEAGKVLARKVGIREAELPRYLALNFKAHESEDPDDPVLMRIGEKVILRRPLVEQILPLLDGPSRNRFLNVVLAVEAVENALAGNITEPTDADIKKLEDTARAKILKASQGRRTLEMVLGEQRLNLPSYRRSLRNKERIRRGILAETEEPELRRHFDRWEVFFQGKMVRVSHLLVRCAENAPARDVTAARARIEALRERIEGGAAFGSVALEVSDDAGSRLRGGDLGFIPRKSPLIAEPFAAAAFALEKGALSRPVRTPSGFHLIQATDRRDGQDVTFEDVRVEVEKDYADSRSVAWIARAREGLTIQVLWEDLKLRAGSAEKEEEEDGGGK